MASTWSVPGSNARSRISARPASRRSPHTSMRCGHPTSSTTFKAGKPFGVGTSMAIPVDADRPRPVPQTRVRTFAGAALLVLLLAACDAAPAACSPGVTAEAAQGIARELAVAGQPAEMTIAEIDSKLYPARPRHG